MNTLFDLSFSGVLCEYFLGTDTHRLYRDASQVCKSDGSPKPKLLDHVNAMAIRIGPTLVDIGAIITTIITREPKYIFIMSGSELLRLFYLKDVGSYRESLRQTIEQKVNN